MNDFFMVLIWLGFTLASLALLEVLRRLRGRDGG